MGEHTSVRWRDRLSSRLGLAFIATALAAVAIVTGVALTASSSGIAKLAAEQRAAVARDVIVALEVAYLEAGGWVDADLLPAHTLAASAGAVLIVTTPDLGELPTPPQIGPTRRRLQPPGDQESTDDETVPPFRGQEERSDHRTGADDTTGGADREDSPGPSTPSTGDQDTPGAGRIGDGSSSSGGGNGGSDDTGSSGSSGENGGSDDSGSSGSSGENGGSDDSGSSGESGSFGGSGGGLTDESDGGPVQDDAPASGGAQQGPATGPAPSSPPDDTRPAVSGEARGDSDRSITLIALSSTASGATAGIAAPDARTRVATLAADLSDEGDPLEDGAELLERIDRSIMVGNEEIGTATLLFVAPTQPDPADGFRASLLPRLLLGAAAAGLLALLITAFVTLRLTRPLRQLTEDVGHLRDDPGRPTAASRPRAPGELGVLRTAIDEMAKDLERQERLRQALAADVGHELRTPVTILLAELEAIRDGVLPVDDEQLDSLHEEVERIARLVEDVSSLADAEASGFALVREPLDLAAVTEAAALGFEAPLRAGGVTLSTTLESVAVVGDRHRLEQVVRNLVTNAARFAPPNSTVEVVVETDGGDAVIKVRDRGPGFRADELPHVFERFWRGRDAAAPGGAGGAGGSGIGLAVVAEVVAAHGGSVAAANRPEGGACLTVRLPRRRADILLVR